MAGDNISSVLVKNPRPLPVAPGREWEECRDVRGRLCNQFLSAAARQSGGVFFCDPKSQVTQEFVSPWPCIKDWKVDTVVGISTSIIRLQVLKSGILSVSSCMEKEENQFFQAIFQFS